MVVQMAMDGAAYAAECINLTQFFYEEALQVALLAAGTARIQKRNSLATEIIENVIRPTRVHLFGFGGYANKIGSTWIAFLNYWMVTQGAYNSINFHMAHQAALDKEKAAQGSREAAGSLCADELQALAKEYGTDVNKLLSNFYSNQNCQYWLNALKQSRGLYQAQSFLNSLSRWGGSLDKVDWQEVYKYFYWKLDSFDYDSLEDYKGNKIPTSGPGTPTKQKRQTVTEVWRTFNSLQKLAYKNLPGGNVMYGYNNLFKYIWRNDTNNVDTYIPPTVAFLQFGIGEPSPTQQFTIVNQEKDFKLSDKPIVQDSIEFIDRTATIQPAIIADLQRGKLKFIRPVIGEVTCEYISGKQIVTREVIGKDIDEGTIYFSNFLPMRWRTLNVYVDGVPVPMIVVQTLYSLMEVRFPIEYDDGDIVTFKTYEPAETVALTIFDEANTRVVWDETTGSDGLIRYSVVVENQPYMIALKYDGIVYRWKEHQTAAEIGVDEYVNVSLLRNPNTGP